jgi:hypothetical protein
LQSKGLSVVFRFGAIWLWHECIMNLVCEDRVFLGLCCTTAHFKGSTNTSQKLYKHKTDCGVDK